MSTLKKDAEEKRGKKNTSSECDVDIHPCDTCDKEDKDMH
jgi:hypothetical protein